MENPQHLAESHRLEVVVEMTHRIWTLVLTSVAFFMVNLGLVVVVTALPAMRHDLGGSLSTLGWIINAYGLAFGAGVITAAAIGDRVGRVRVFVAGIAIFTAGSIACAVAQDTTTLIAGRVVQGIGAATIMPLSLTILSCAFPPERRGVVIGLWGGIAGIGVAAGPLIGGAVTQGLDWHWVFWVNVPIGVIAAVLSLVFLRESRGPSTRLDLVGVALITAGALALIWGLVRGNDAGWSSSEVLGSFAAGALLIAGFTFWELRATAPLVPMRLFASGTFVAANSTGFLLVAALLASAFLISQFFQFGLRYSPLEAGIRILPWTATPIVISPLAGALSDRIGRRPLMAGGMLLAAVGLGWFALIASTAVDYAQLILPLVVVGVGISAALPTTPAAVLNSVAPPDIGKASGVASTLQRFGGVFGVAVATAVFSTNGHLGTPAAFTAGFRPALAITALFALVAGLSALGVSARAIAAPAAQPVPEAA
jgi:EmrB/QacA subfamily drug resistance transporter